MKLARGTSLILARDMTTEYEQVCPHLGQGGSMARLYRETTRFLLTTIIDSEILAVLSQRKFPKGNRHIRCAEVFAHLGESQRDNGEGIEKFPLFVDFL